MFFANSQYYKFSGSYQDAIPQINTQGEFFNVARLYLKEIEKAPFYEYSKRWMGKYEDERSSGIQYYLLRQNIGLVNWYSNINLDENAVPRYGVLIGYGDYWKDFRRDLSRRNGILKNENYQGRTVKVVGTGP